MKDNLIGDSFILFEIAVIWYISKQPKNIALSSFNNFQGCIGEVGFIFLGLIFVFGG